VVTNLITNQVREEAAEGNAEVLEVDTAMLSHQTLRALNGEIIPRTRLKLLPNSKMLLKLVTVNEDFKSF
jgi:ABC-type uncharacterized transport system YnjBCD substrate-binding protein